MPKLNQPSRTGGSASGTATNSAEPPEGSDISNRPTDGTVVPSHTHGSSANSGSASGSASASPGDNPAISNTAQSAPPTASARLSAPNTDGTSTTTSKSASPATSNNSTHSHSGSGFTQAIRQKLRFDDEATWRRFSARRLELIDTYALSTRKGSEQYNEIRTVAEILRTEYGYPKEAVFDFDKLVLAGIQSVRRNRKRPNKSRRDAPRGDVGHAGQAGQSGHAGLPGLQGLPNASTTSKKFINYDAAAPMMRQRSSKSSTDDDTAPLPALKRLRVGESPGGPPGVLPGGSQSGQLGPVPSLVNPAGSALPATANAMVGPPTIPAVMPSAMASTMPSAMPPAMPSAVPLAVPTGSPAISQAVPPGMPPVTSAAPLAPLSYAVRPLHAPGMTAAPPMLPTPSASRHSFAEAEAEAAKMAQHLWKTSPPVAASAKTRFAETAARSATLKQMLGFTRPQETEASRKHFVHTLHALKAVGHHVSASSVTLALCGVSQSPHVAGLPAEAIDRISELLRSTLLCEKFQELLFEDLELEFLKSNLLVSRNSFLVSEYLGGSISSFLNVVVGALYRDSLLTHELCEPFLSDTVVRAVARLAAVWRQKGVIDVTQLHSVAGTTKPVTLRYGTAQLNFTFNAEANSPPSVLELLENGRSAFHISDATVLQLQDSASSQVLVSDADVEQIFHTRDEIRLELVKAHGMGAALPLPLALRPGNNMFQKLL